MEASDFRYEDLASDEAIALIHYEESKRGKFQPVVANSLFI
jgi:hypothetical protein